MNFTQIKSGGDIQEVIPNLFIGNMWSTDPNVLHQHGIEVVLNVAQPEIDANKGRYKLHSYLVLQVDDTPSASKKMISEIIPKAMTYIDQFLHPSAPKQRRVLVHCAAGVSRSATVVIAWLMKTYLMDRDKAYTLLKSRRNIIQPNEGFMEILKQWGQYMKRYTAVSATRERRTHTTGRAYNYPGINHPYIHDGVGGDVVPVPVDNRNNNYNKHLHHLFQGDQLDNYENMQNRQFERQFSVLPSETNTLTHPQEAPSYYREYEEKIHASDDHFKHLY